MKNISKTLNIISIFVFIVAFLTKGYNISRFTMIVLGIAISDTEPKATHRLLPQRYRVIHP